MYQASFIIDRDDENRLTRKLFDLGAGSVSSCHSHENEITLMALFDDITQMEKFFSQDQYVISKLEEEVWKYRWLEEYEGFPVNDRIYIIPVTSDYIPSGEYRHVIRLDPRDAFGDGRHPTTTLCLVHMEKILSAVPQKEIEHITMIDAGTGTGVLAILAAMMGITNIDAVDIDPAAVDNAAYNARINNCAHINFTASDISAFATGRVYDYVVANLLTDIVKKSITSLMGLLKEKGTMLLSGISTQWHSEVMELFNSHNLVVRERHVRENWSCYILNKSIIP